MDLNFLKLENFAAKITLYLYSCASLPRKVVQIFLDIIISFLYNEFIPCFERQLHEKFKIKQKVTVADIIKLLKDNVRCFDCFSTETI